MKVFWANNALANLQAIHDYVAQNSPSYATRLVDGITRRSQQIAVFPMSGRVVPEYESDDIREVIEARYRIIYRIKVDQLDVLAVLHGAQQIPPKP